MPTPNIDDLPDGPNENPRPRKPIPRDVSGEDIYEQPTLRLKEKPNSEHDKFREGNIRESWASNQKSSTWLANKQ